MDPLFHCKSWREDDTIALDSTYEVGHVTSGRGQSWARHRMWHALPFRQLPVNARPAMQVMSACVWWVHVYYQCMCVISACAWRAHVCGECMCMMSVYMCVMSACVWLVYVCGEYMCVVSAYRQLSMVGIIPKYTHFLTIWAGNARGRPPRPWSHH